ncbi:TVP38/TMEM64 family protein [Fictibacillus fluitans]|uniref:TVP38/TMEM64 family membrane protein n=1 Tax=Fictibacillus fluitans TaxID=3058422 RepID=A0ABT8HWW0_9BACL|nr:VTT domain-containing protein [Fictibacillus sp. NE201]MDN4525199.1 VTT domain-containing protein [Fictibacillus sp. NE201]
MTALKDIVIDWLLSYGQLAVMISIFMNVVISVLGVVPSVFLTAANLAVFGLWPGMAVSFIGEAVGAVVSFVLYRKGFRKAVEWKAMNHPKIKQLLEARGKEAFLLILALRILPFMPSGVVTFVAAVGKASLWLFVLASSIGKIPAILIEGYSVYQLIQWSWEGKLVATIMAVFLLLWCWKKLRTP